MSWFFIALIGPFLYALTNHIDKVLLEKYFKEGGVGTLILFSSLLSALALPFLFMADPTVLNVSIPNILILAFVGILNVAVLWCYLLALKDEEASVAVVFYQLVPVFGYILGYIILGEVLTQMQLIAMAIVIFGTSIISFEIDAENKFKLRKNTIVLMLAAAFFWGLESVIFKAVALEEQLWRSLFWEHMMLAFAGVLIFIFIASYRKHFLSAIKNNSGGILGLNVANESIYMVGNIAFSVAYLMAPVALVLLTESYQPLFVFAIGIFLTIFFPKLITEKIEARHLWQKAIAICVTGIGTYMLFAF
ncbi:DMT family transporter [Patescibacteria group bacterium]|nr:DMT family transporter [Patescibacteria group bacterium]MBU1754931.1 DMT family transporter [Patescibacteria group bacterium]